MSRKVGSHFAYYKQVKNLVVLLLTLNAVTLFITKSYKLNTTITPNNKSYELNTAIMPNNNEKRDYKTGASDGTKKFSKVL